MDRGWSVEVGAEHKRLISDRCATRSGNVDGIFCFNKRIDRRIYRRSLWCTFRVRRYPDGGSRWADQFLLKSIIIRRYDGKEESEHTHSANQINPSQTARHSEAGERPASKSCEAPP